MANQHEQSHLMQLHYVFRVCCVSIVVSVLCLFAIVTIRGKDFDGISSNNPKSLNVLLTRLSSVNRANRTSSNTQQKLKMIMPSQLLVRKKTEMNNKSRVVDDGLLTKPITSFPYNSVNKNRPNIPIILMWTKFHNKRTTRLLSRLEACPQKCLFTDDTKLLSSSSVVVFHGTDLYINMLPSTVYKDQIKLFVMRESPGRHSAFYRHWNMIPMNYFNSTMTYRKDSDYNAPYFTFHHHDQHFDKKKELAIIEQKVSKKSKLVFSLISHCDANSGRDTIITKLSKFAKVDRYGKCDHGSKCDEDCEIKLLEDYYFYLAFENSLCDEYLTEKFGRLHNYIVPITLKRSLVSKEIPQEAYIAVDDFCSLEQLADHLVYLSTNRTAYMEHFKWRTEGYIRPERSQVWCQLCDDVINGNVKTRDYSNFNNIQKFMPRSQCNNDYKEYLIEDTCDPHQDVKMEKLKALLKDFNRL